MVSGIKIYKITDFIRKTETGKIDLRRSKQIIEELVEVAGNHTDHNILIDLRETSVSITTLEDVITVALEFGSFSSSFKNKIANVISDDKERFSIANQMKSCMDIQGFEYQFFTDYEDAIEWLSDIEEQNANGI
jgi:predicted transcriptional regulator